MYLNQINANAVKVLGVIFNIEVSLNHAWLMFDIF